ncbi:MAG TPA: GNAT family N-acetyltransferase [Longimicrobiaceae bacterium]|nr:GNAT family N-acetyltransferase [Longimicrobiaceae bacterium]
MPPAPDAPLLETPRLRLHPLAAGGEARLQAVFRAAPDAFPGSGGRGAGAEPDAAERELHQCAATPGREVAVLTLRGGGEDVGAIGWWSGHPGPGLALLGTLIVAPGHRGRGLAREALDALSAWLAEAGAQALRTGVERRRLGAYQALRALGFVELSIAEHTRLGLAGAGMALMEKRLRAG